MGSDQGFVGDTDIFFLLLLVDAGKGFDNVGTG